MSTKKEKCDCAEMSCPDDCTRNHTHKTFSCKECQSESIEWKEAIRDWWYERYEFKLPEAARVELEHIVKQAITTAVAKEKQSIWKEVFEKGYEFSGQDLKEAVKAREKELVEDVEKMKVWPPEIFDRKDLSGQREKGFNEAIDKILSILKH